MTQAEEAATRIIERNADLARWLLTPLVKSERPGLPQITNLQADPSAACVYFDLELDGRSVRIELSNLEPAKPAFLHSSSFTVCYQSDHAAKLPGPLLRALRLMGRVIAARDGGGLRFVAPGTRRGGPDLFLLRSANEIRQHRWSREVFDGALRQLIVQRPGPHPHVVAVVSQPCEMQCQFCPQTDRDKARDDWVEKGDDRQLEDLLYQLERARAAGAEVVDLGGNDVLRFGRIFDLLNGAGLLGFREIIVQSTGLPLADPSFAEALAKSAATEIDVPIYGTDAQTHDSVTCTPGSFDRLVRGIDNARSHGRPRIRLHTIALASTLGRLEGLIDFVRERWGAALLVTPLRPNRLGERDHLGDAARLEDLRVIMARYPSHFSREFPLCQRTLESALDAYLPAPPPPPLHVFDLGMQGVEHARVKRDRTMLQAEPCRGCGLRDGCGGVLGAYLDRFGSSELRPFPSPARPPQRP